MTMMANGQARLRAMPLSPVALFSHQGHKPMTIVELLGTKLSPLADGQTHQLKNRSQRVELLGAKPLTPVPHKKGQRAAGIAQAVGAPDQVVMVAHIMEISTPMKKVTG